MSDTDNNAARRAKFLEVEYPSLRAQSTQDTKQIGDVLRYGIALSGGIWAWLITTSFNAQVCLSESTRSISLSVLSLLPFILTGLLAWQVNRLRKFVAEIGEYLYQVEREFSLAPDLGFESRRRHRPPAIETPAVDRWIWIVLIAGNGIGALITWCHYFSSH